MATDMGALAYPPQAPGGAGVGGERAARYGWQAPRAEAIANSMTSCVFCGIAAGTEPAQVVCEWSDAVAFTPINPVADGHVLVIPRVHVPNALENPAITAATVARTVELALACDRYEACNILTSVGTAATQSVAHLHIHLVPRTSGDQLMLPWGTTGDPHAPHWCKVAERLSTELAELRAEVGQ